MPSRRQFLEALAGATGAVVLMPVVTACKKKDEGGSEAPAEPPKQAANDEAGKDAPPKDEPKPAGPAEPPTAKPEGWDPIAYNKERGNAGAIPESYLPSINGPDGENKHLGKHLPYQPKVEAKLVPDGFIALMWGDPDKGHAKHPNAKKSPDNDNHGHWYNWIKIRKAGDGEVEELQSEYTDWPGTNKDDSGKYAVFGGGDIEADGGKNTIYLAGMPKDLKSGDTIRIWAHCLTHGEYVDFLTLA
jgi:hypothetical protein